MPSPIGGLRPKPKDAFVKRFSLTRNFGAPSLDVPKRFSIEDQKGDVNGPRRQGPNFCTACTVSEIGADEWGIPMSQKFQALAISLILKNPLHSTGASLDDSMKSGRTYGFLPLSLEPKSIQKLDLVQNAEAICNPANWSSSVFIDALKYVIPGGDFFVDGPYDAFDNFRSQLYQHRPDNGISLGICWPACFNSTRTDGIIRCSAPDGSWHDVAFKGWEVKEDGQPYAILRSWDPEAGKQSYFYASRKRFNDLMAVPGAVGKMYKNLDERIVADLKERKLSLREQILNLFYQVSYRLSQL